jgi:hypothetical protein
MIGAGTEMARLWYGWVEAFTLFMPNFSTVIAFKTNI